MKRISIFFLTAFMLSYMNVAAQCDHTDDFTRTGADNWVRTVTSADGWTWQRCYHDENSEEVKINGGGMSYQGYILSPVFSNGFNSISFYYQTLITQQCKSFSVLAVQNGVETAIETITISSENYDKWVFVKWTDLAIEGDFQIKIKNETPGPLNSNMWVFSVKQICISSQSAPPAPPHNIQISAPKDATVFVGDKDRNVTVGGNFLTKHYVPFTPKPAVHVAETDTSRIWYYDLPSPKDGDGFNFRVTRAGKAPHVGLFKLPRAPRTCDTLVFTDALLDMRDARDIDHDVNNIIGRNVADMFININGQGHLTLPLRADTAFQIINTRNWQAINTDCNNYFIEPDFHYTVVDENGAPSSGVITVSDSGVIRPVGAGRAIVQIHYDAMLCHHTNNGGCGATSVSGVRPDPRFYGASWAENTAVFVVSVEQPEAGVKPNMFINDYWNQQAADKVDSVNIDAEHDVLYYEASTGGFDFTFKPEGATSVLLASPRYADTLAVNGQSPAPEGTRLYYGGFSADKVKANADGSYTVTLGFGRNIVKLASSSGASYQVITAKPVSYVVSNLTHPGDELQAGDEFTVVFNTLYHPSNKMSGIYNMSAGIQYTGFDTDFPLILGPGQYTFASRAQEYKRAIPADFNGDEVLLTNGVIKVSGFGSYYGEHRKISIQNGVPPNLSASVRTAYFGALPAIRLPFAGTPPSEPVIVAHQPTDLSVALRWTASTDNVGVAGYVLWMNGDSIATVADTLFTVEGLTPATEYRFEVAAFDTAGYRSTKASVTESTTSTGATLIPPQETTYDEERGVYVADCGANSVVIAIVPTDPASTVTINGEERTTATVDISKPGYHIVEYSVVSRDGQVSEQTVKIEKRFDFNALVVARWDNTLIVNNNPATNGGYSFAAFKWYRNGAEIGTGQYYSAGAHKSDLLDANAEYSVAATTVGGDTLHTCPARITATRSTEIMAYPNPVSNGETVLVDIASDETDNTAIEVYTLAGQRLDRRKASGRITPVAFPYPAGVYLVKVVTGNSVKDFKIVVR